MYAQITYTGVVTTDTTVDTNITELTPTVKQANRNGIEITNCTAVNLYLAGCSSLTATTSSLGFTFDATHFDSVLVSGASKTFGSGPGVRWFAFTASSSGNVRMKELI